MKRKVGIVLIVFLLILILVSQLVLADLRTEKIKDDPFDESLELYAKNILSLAAIRQGFDKHDEHTTYAVTCRDYWRGLIGKIGNPWSWNNDQMILRYAIGDFDGQVEVLEGWKKGYLAGLQSWNYYEKANGSIQDNVPDNKGVKFTLSAFHYFFELAPRLSRAPVIRFAGTDRLKGQHIDKVFVSWGLEVSKDYDQYVVWIGRKSGRIEAVEFTTRDNFMPAPGFLYGSMRFDEFTDVDGVLIPFKQTAFIGRPKEELVDFVHQLSIQKFEWDSFPISDIRPLADLEPLGDDKPNN